MITDRSEPLSGLSVIVAAFIITAIVIGVSRTRQDTGAAPGPAPCVCPIPEPEEVSE